MILALAAAAALMPQVDALAARTNFAGEILIAKGDRVALDKAYGTVDPAGGAKHKVGATWRLASITKQVTAAYILATPMAQELDTPLKKPPLGGLTLRQLLSHHTGLPNPDSTPVVDGMPSFYQSPRPNLPYCTSAPARPGAAFSYNNCDFLLAYFEAYGFDSPWPDGLTMAKPGEKGVPGFVGNKPEPPFELASFGAAGGLLGTADAIWRFDRSIMPRGSLARILPADFWKPEGNGSYQALGQWVFPGKLAGCAAPKRIVQRDGEILGVQTRNFIFPDDDLVVIVFTNRSSDDFKLGEVWEGKGFVYDLLSAAACGAPAN